MHPMLHFDRPDLAPLGPYESWFDQFQALWVLGHCNCPRQITAQACLGSYSDIAELTVVSNSI